MKPCPETTEDIEHIVNVDYDINGEDIEDIHVDYVTLKSGVGVELPGQLKKMLEIEMLKS